MTARLPVSFGILLLAFATRLAYLLYSAPELHGVYWDLSTSLLRDGTLGIDGRPVTGYEPGYPAFLGLARALTGDRAFAVAILQVGFASIGAVYLHRLTLSLTRNTTAAAIGGVLFAIDPLLVRQAVLHSEPAVLITLLLGFTCAFMTARSTPDAVRAGVWLGAVVLTRSMTLPLLAAATALLALRHRFAAAAALAATVVALAVPFILRNHAVNGSWLPSRGGLNLYVGNSTYTDALLPDHDVDLLIPVAAMVIRSQRPDVSIDAADYETIENRILTAEALKHMRDDPGRTLRRKALNVLYFFSPRPVPYWTIGDDTRLVFPGDDVVVEGARGRPMAEVVGYGLWHSAVLILGAVGVYNRRHQLRGDALLWWIVATFVVVYAVYFPATRYRAPITFVLLFYAAVALDSVLRSAVRRPRSALLG